MIRKLISEDLISCLDFGDKKLEDLIVSLQELSKEYHEKGYVNLSIENRQDKFSDNWDLALIGTRFETDAEYNKRIEKKKKIALANKNAKFEKEAKEFAEFERLKKKFEGKK